MIGDLVVLVAATLAILGASELFTNSIEWLGVKLEISEGATGSLLAAVGTALPETIIPILAILFLGGDGPDIGVGAILGAPFMLSTLALGVTGVAAIAYRRRRGGWAVQPDQKVLRRDLVFFLVAFVPAVAAGVLRVPHPLRTALAVALLGVYVTYSLVTLQAEGAATRLPERLHFRRHVDIPHVGWVAIQVLASLVIMVGGANFFVRGVEDLAHIFHASPLLLSLVVTPVATELPEKFNSVLWVRRSRDTLAMANISGAMVFQSAFPCAVGLAFTAWEVQGAALISAAVTVLAVLVIMVSARRRLDARWLLVHGGLYVIFVAGLVGFSPGRL
jgi:cation:H+ antiporter